MNKAKLTDCLWQHVRLRPIARRRTPEGEWLAPIDDDWIVTEVASDALHIQNIRTGHVPRVGLVHTTT